MNSTENDTLPTQSNLIGALIGATSGATMAVLLWSAVTTWQPDTFFIAMPLLVGGFAGGAAQLLGGSTARSIGVIAVIVALLALVLGDFMETTMLAVNSGSIPGISGYGEEMLDKLAGSPLRMLVYAATPLMAYASAVTAPRRR